jgi:predicted ferric reductase/Ca2+-binding EF-hand superfamily protein
MNAKRRGRKPPRRGLTPLATVLEALSDKRRPGGVDAVDVQKALGLRSLFLAKRLLVALGGDQRPFETAEEFVAVAEKMMAAPVGLKIEFLFKLHDVDGDGSIRRDELEQLIHIAMAEHDLRLPEGEANRLVEAVMRAGDLDGDGRISMAEFVQMMLAHPELQARLSDYGVSLLMPGKRARERALPPGSAWGGWVRSAALVGFWLTIYSAVNALLFAQAFLHYRHAGANVYIQLARGAGACLNFNAALIVIPMLRHTLTWVRRSMLGRLVPVDDAVGAHALVGEAVVLFSLIHSGAHVLNVHGGRLERLKEIRLGTLVPWSNNTYTTGVALLGIFLLMWLFSRRFVRRSGRFELFHLTHLGYLASLPLLFLHGPRFWMWGTVPWLWYFAERAFRGLTRRSPSQVLEAMPMPSGVTKLVFERPPEFDYTPGDYVFLRIPAVARQEWHPFTLTSAPEDSERLSVHIRSLGNWSSKVFDRIADREEEGLPTVVHIDGPYGSASRHIFEAPHAVAIAAGIGVTPFASILKSLLAGHTPEAPLRKLRFVWLAKEQWTFEWFRGLLAELEKQDVAGLLDIHIYMTSGRADMAGGIIDVAQHVLRAKREGDIITGLRTRTSMGMPDFDRLLESFYRHPGLARPEVFFCGPAPLGRVIARSCRRLKLSFRSERF